MAKDYYKTLGVGKDATKDDIKQAYKKLAKKFHPDLNKESGAAEKFKEINEAASVLADDQKRASYDQYGTAEPGAAGGFGTQGGFDFSGFDPFDFDSIFDTIFGGGGGYSRGGFGDMRGSRDRTGADLRYDLEISLEDVAFGAKKKIQVPHTETCPRCRGTGAASDSDVKTCERCQGRGVQRSTRRTPFGIFSTTTTCSMCGGTGQTIETPCSGCGGKGSVRKTTSAEVEIPPGVEHGSTLRLKGLGMAGDRGGSSGNLYVVLHIQQHDVFERDGNDLHVEVPISITQAALGAEIVVPTLNGKASLKIPSGTQTHTQFRMKGKGLPDLNGDGEGSEMVRVIIQTPSRLSRKQRELLAEYAKESGESATPDQGFFDKIRKAFES